MVTERGYSSQRSARATRTFGLWTLLACAILLFGVLGATVTYLSRRELGQQTRSWLGQVTVETLFWLTYLPLVLPTLALARRFRLDPSNWQTRNVLMHVLGATCFSLAHSLVIGLLRFAVGSVQSPWSNAMFLLANFALVDFCLYWGILAGFFAIDFYRESVARDLTAAHLRADLTEARLQALRIQLTPHFLFNTLNCMSTLSLAGDHLALRAMIVNLGELLRFSLDDRCPQEVPLDKELAFLERYLDLQRLQFGDQLLLRRQIADDTLGALVPTLVLQPIVENAIVHGCSSREGRRHISIRAVRDGETLHLSVSDDGPGFPPSGTPIKHGIGLGNTEQRLENLYGPNQHIDYGNAPNGGATVTLSIPFHVESTAPAQLRTGNNDSYAYR